MTSHWIDCGLVRLRRVEDKMQSIFYLDQGEYEDFAQFLSFSDEVNKSERVKDFEIDYHLKNGGVIHAEHFISAVGSVKMSLVNCSLELNKSLADLIKNYWSQRQLK